MGHGQILNAACNVYRYMIHFVSDPELSKQRAREFIQDWVGTWSKSDARTQASAGLVHIGRRSRA